MPLPPILDNKHPAAPSMFLPAALIREARRQKKLPAANVPEICILDPDGDLVANLVRSGEAQRFSPWPCYHSDLYSFALAGESVGIVGRAVGAPFAVLIAEQLFACGCRLLISLTSAGQIGAVATPPYFVVIARALRDEGTSYHYLPPAEFAEAEPALVTLAGNALRATALSVFVGASWTTDAPFRETEEAIAAARGKDVLAVEMEAAALYAFAQARAAQVLCLAHVTNVMGQAGADFEKGEGEGSVDALQAIGAIVTAWRVPAGA
ncbi:MAG: nucleoside phosphorylase [Candidatus Hydrogenedentes bacterium]|nr:nucleoside phosphorylase [Candidatus Hydrogenedentota bacterium]